MMTHSAKKQVRRELLCGEVTLVTNTTTMKQNKLTFPLRHHTDDDTRWFEGATAFTHHYI